MRPGLSNIKNPQDLALFLAVFLALMWLSDPTANTKSISRAFRLLFGFGHICYMESLWAELLQFGSKHLQRLE